MGPLSDENVTRLQEKVKSLFRNVNELKMAVKELKEEFANQLPNWGTALIAVLTALLGGCAGTVSTIAAPESDQKRSE
ncbi:MAG: hypothetical protein VB084_06455 [Syntrophomonadaceae bacterium]|nr:hypothetical protein [Syntrophomonadaceae bacterium]